MPNYKQKPSNKDKTTKLLEICQKAIDEGQTIKLNQTLRDLSLHPDIARTALNKNPQLKAAIRSKKEAIAQDKALSLEEAQSRLPDQNDKVLYFKDGKYHIQTKDGAIYTKISSKLHQGNPRGKCGASTTEEDIYKQLKSIGYTLVPNTYVIKRTPLSAIHDICGVVRTNRLSNFFKQECPSCSNTGCSKQERAINNWIQSLGLYTEKYRFKGKTRGKEIDIYIPSLNIGIEYCGLYYHQDTPKNNKNSTYHYNKMIQANEEGIRLLTIFEDEWINRQEQVKNFLKSVLGICYLRIFARKCVIKEVDCNIAREFLDQNHIQGKALFKVAIGLYYNDDLLGLVTGNTHHRLSESHIFVLNRLVFKSGVHICGGASRLLNQLIIFAKNNGYKELVSWSDNRWSQGNVYQKVGFLLEKELPPDYSYVTPTGIRQSKQSNTKKSLLKKGAIGNIDNTETELSLSLGYHRIWDCGKKRWVIKI